jgi:hypothetical protein
MIDVTFAQEFAEAWVEAWNAHDLDAILSHYTDDFEMSSPFIIERMQEPSGTLKGKDRIRPYWQISLSRTPPLHFTLLNVLIGAQSIILHFRRESGQLGAEVLFFNAQRQVIKGVAHWTAA